jgi:outer membrane protein TolC
VLIARLNTDVSLADFESAVIQLVSDVENAYWELYFAYRDLDAKLAARRQAYDTWRQIHVLFNQGPGGQLEASAEAQARE